MKAPARALRLSGHALIRRSATRFARDDHVSGGIYRMMTSLRAVYGRTGSPQSFGRLSMDEGRGGPGDAVGLTSVARQIDQTVAW